MWLKEKKQKKKSIKAKRKKSRKASVARKKTRKVRKSKRKKVRKSKRKKVRKSRKINFKSPKLIEDSDGKSIIKVSDSWDKHAYINKSKYQKNISFRLKRMKNSGQRKERELLG